MIETKANWAVRLTVVSCVILLSGCGGGGTPVLPPSAAAIAQAKSLGGTAIDPTHRDAGDLLAIESGAAALPGGPDERGTHTPPPDLHTGSTGAAKQRRVASTDPVETTKAAKNTTAIRAVAVPQVKGAPGAGNRELTAAMRQVLQNAGWPVRNKPGNDTLTVRGKVKLGQKQKGTQPVVLAWVVTDPAGSVLGTVKQANKVPAGSVDQGFGPNAKFVAQAAAPGIFNLVKDAKR